jgi:hypothetical protein
MSAASVRRRIGRLAIVAAILATCGCGTTLTAGRRPDVARLAGLSAGASTKADVVRALGPPKGAGRALFPQEERPRDLWWYYAEETTRSDARRLVLFVFFDGDRYTGNMWFGSLPPSSAMARAGKP